MSVLLGEQKFVPNERSRSLHPHSQILKDIERAKAGISVSRWRKIKRYIRYFYQKLRLKYFIPLIVVAIYAFIGAGLFMATEKAFEEDKVVKKIESIHEARLSFTDEIKKIFRNNSLIKHRPNLTYELLQQYEEQIGFNSDITPKWNFWDSTYYAVTIFTTIGEHRSD